MEKNNLKLVFMGTPEISAYVFEKMIEAGYHFVGLVAQPDHPVGRKGLIEKVPTKVIAEKYNIPVFQYGMIALLILFECFLYRDSWSYIGLRKTYPELRGQFARSVKGWEIVHRHTKKNDLVQCNPRSFHEHVWKDFFDYRLWCGSFL